MLNQNEIIKSVCRGRARELPGLINAALAAGDAPSALLNDCLIAAMGEVGDRFRKNEIYIPEVMMAARAVDAGVAVLRPLFENGTAEKAGRVVIGTVKGDLHDIGKNIVKIMLGGRGLDVIDLGTDVPPEKFIDTAVENGCRVILLSALLTSTMKVMGDVVQLRNERGLSGKIKIMVGGAPVSQSFCDKIGADCYTSDAASAAEAALSFVKA